MAKKNRQKARKSRKPTRGANTEHTANQDAVQEGFYNALMQADWETAWREAETLVARYPRHVAGYKAMARYAEAQSQIERAVDSLGAAVDLETSRFDDLYELGLLARKVGAPELAITFYQRALEIEPENTEVQSQVAVVHGMAGRWNEAVSRCDELLEGDPDNADLWRYRGHALSKLRRAGEALESALRAVELAPELRDVHNNAGLLYVDRGDYQRASYHYQQELAVHPENEQPRLNLFIAKHYNPDFSAEALFEASQAWEAHHAPINPPPRAQTSLDASRPLRIGLISSGFRAHPAGTMSLEGLRNLSRDDYELYCYTTNDQCDGLTEAFQAIARRWRAIGLYGSEALADVIREDKIDILIDMSGAGDGCRFGTLALQPAPILVKWVGGHINTTGLSFMDYMISDSVETPPGVDPQYTEKLIRMPDDYICYFPTTRPKQTSLPAITNGYVTFGCLNNPAKLNDQLLEQWALLLHNTPGSRLLLRGAQFGEEDFCDEMRQRFSTFGIGADRLILEGPASHEEFLKTYQRIDIALDSWPYSGGLTTCEALLMGVPVVTRVGPTFAGRHSAAHLTNAGLPELVTDNWEDFHARVKELVDDLPNLAVIRAGLRTILLESPVCDGERFGRHLSTALRAIWQRHCEGAEPAALTFNKAGQAQFEDEDEPVNRRLARSDAGFDWGLDSPVVAIDNGATLAARADADQLLASGNLAILSFDPEARLDNADWLAQHGEFQHFPQVTLGEGQSEEMPSITLDSIEGLESIDLLVLDGQHGDLSILQGGEQALSQTLVIQVRVSLQGDHPTYPAFEAVNQWAWEHGFRFYCTDAPAYVSHMPESVPANKRQASELDSVIAVFLPSRERVESLNNDRRLKLGYVLHAVYGIRDAAYWVLLKANDSAASNYLAALTSLGKKSDLRNDASDAGRSLSLEKWASMMAFLGPGDDLPEITLPY